MVISRQKTQQGITESAAIWYKTDDMKKNRREKEEEQLHISNIEYSRQLMLKLVFILVSCLLIFKICLSHTCSFQGIFARLV